MDFTKWFPKFLPCKSLTSADNEPTFYMIYGAHALFRKRRFEGEHYSVVLQLLDKQQPLWLNIEANGMQQLL